MQQTYPDERRERLHGLLLVVAVHLDDLQERHLVERLLGERSENGEERLMDGVRMATVSFMSVATEMRRGRQRS